MGSDVWARWLTGLGVSVALISLVFGIWLQLETETSRGIGSYATTIRLSYALPLAPFAMGLRRGARAAVPRQRLRPATCGGA